MNLAEQADAYIQEQVSQQHQGRGSSLSRSEYNVAKSRREWEQRVRN